MNTSDGYARQPVVSSSNVRLARTATVFVMGVLGISYMSNAMDRQVFPALLGGIRATYGFCVLRSVVLLLYGFFTQHSCENAWVTRWLQRIQRSACMAFAQCAPSSVVGRVTGLEDQRYSLAMPSSWQQASTCLTGRRTQPAKMRSLSFSA